MRWLRSKPKENVWAVRGLGSIPSLFVGHCLEARRGDKSQTSVGTERQRGGFFCSPQLLEYTVRHNPLLALRGDYWLNGIGGISPHLGWDHPLEWHGVHFRSVRNVGFFIGYLCNQEACWNSGQRSATQEIYGIIHIKRDLKGQYLFAVFAALKMAIYCGTATWNWSKY